MLNCKVRISDLTANYLPHFFFSRKKQEAPISEGKTKRADEQSDKQDVQKEIGNPRGVGLQFISESWKKFIDIHLTPAIKYHTHLL